MKMINHEAHEGHEEKRNGWPCVRLGDVCRQDRQLVAPEGPDARELPYLSLEHIESQTGRILREPSAKIGDEGKSTTFRFDERHALYGKLRPYLNKVALPDFAGRCTTEMIPLLPDANLRREYLGWILRRDETVAFALQQNTGSRMPRADMDSLLSLEIPLPPLAEQERIAGRLTEQMAGVQRARAAAAERLADAQALPAAYLRDVFEGTEAKQWPTRRLGDLLTRYNMIIHPGDRTDGDARFVGLEHVQANTGRRIGSLPINLGKLTGRKPTFLRGQIVYGYLRPYLNKVWIAEFDGCSSVDQFAFDVKQDRGDTEFVAAFMRSETFLRRAAIVTTTGQLPRISVDEIAAVKIELPASLPAQKRIAAKLSRRLSETERLTSTLRQELAAIDALPAALLRQAFREGGAGDGRHG